MGAVLYATHHGKKLLAAAAVLLMLPVLFVLMLLSLIFGGLTSNGASSQPTLNENAAIVQNTNDIAFAVNQVLVRASPMRRSGLPRTLPPLAATATRSLTPTPST